MGDKILVIAQTGGQSGKIVSVVKRLRENSENQVVVVTLAANTQKEMLEDQIPWKTYEDYSTKEAYEKVNREAFFLAENWHRPEFVKRLVSYHGINLGSLVEYEFAFFLAELMKHVEVVSHAIDLERPNKIVVIDGKDRLEKVLRILAGLKGIPVIRTKSGVVSRLRNSIVKDSIPMTIEFGKHLTTFNIPRSLMFPYLKRILDYVGKTWLRILRSSSDAGRAPNSQSLSNRKKKILMLDFNVLEHHWLIMELRKKYEILLINERRPLGWCYGALTFLSKNSLPYRTLRDYNTGEIRKRINIEASSLRNRLKNLGNNTGFKNAFSYGDIPLWALVRDRLSYVFGQSFLEKIEYVEVIRHLLAAERVDIILAWNPVLEFEKTAISVGNLVGVPSLIIQHGMTGSHFGFLPLIASEMAVWGKASRNWLIKEGAPKDKLVVLGNPKFDELVQKEAITRDRIYRALGADPKKGLIVLATQPLSLYRSILSKAEKEGEMVIRSVFKAASEFPQKQLVVKLHPVEGGELHKTVAKETKTDVIITKNVNLYELLGACELLITVSSTVALEAMVLGKPVITINLFNRRDPNRYAESGAAIGVYRPEDIASAIKKALYDQQTRRSLEIARKKFVYDYAYEQDGHASKRIESLIAQMIDHSQGNRAGKTLAMKCDQTWQERSFL